MPDPSVFRLVLFTQTTYKFQNTKVRVAKGSPLFTDATAA